MNQINVLFEYLEQVNLATSLIVLIVISVILGIILLFKKPKLTKPLFYIGMTTLGIWVIILCLTILGALPIHQEAFISSECCSFFQEVPTWNTTLIAILPFVMILFLIASFISKKTAKAKSTKTTCKK